MRLAFAAVLVLVSCGSTAPQSEVSQSPPIETASTTEPTAEQRFPDVVAAEATQDAGGTWTFAVTLSSPYDTPDRYADSWRVKGPDGTVYGERFLTHDHANEQPFTRSQSGIEIPDNVDTVEIEGRDQVYGWGGTTLTLELQRP
ncbi:MAG: hypothetical protein HKN24_09915 [Acidimicrobiales bacterium]|nr:hypothetical protein [Acidimicrobiales bacterium]